MTEREEPVAVKVVRLVCECGGEIVRAGGFSLSSCPPQHPHECKACGKEMYVPGGKTYPHLRYVTQNTDTPTIIE